MRTSDVTLECRGLAVGYTAGRGNRTIVAQDLDVVLHRGELVCLLGPNGAGKSTLMRTLCGMQAPLAGEVRLDGDPVHQLSPRQLARRLSVVLTDRVATGLLTGYELVALGRHPFTDWSGRLTARDHDVIRHSIEAVGAVALASRRVAELSDGERQKVMMARALAQEPRVMILDEITAFLDLPRRVEMMRTLRSLAREQQRAILLSTHDLELALRASDRLWLLSKGGGFVTGPPEHLVMTGAFEAAFASEGLEFDPHTGAFKLHQTLAGAFLVTGDGLPRTWTTRALEREGFQVVSPERAPAATAHIEVIVSDAALLWRHTEKGVSTQHGSLEELLRMLRQPA